jgi:metal-sulfur cluster biosynthetic enzyme
MINERRRNIWYENLILEVLRNITDPEKPYTIEELAIVDEDCVIVNKGYFINLVNGINIVKIEITPTIPTCSLVLDIGLSIRYAIEKELGRIKVELCVKPGTHLKELEGNSKLNS